MSSFKSQKFAVLRRASRVWAIASVHGEAARLKRLQAAIRERFRPGDRLVYLGNVMGRGPAVHEAIDALLSFRTAVLAQPGIFACDTAILRGRQEEMWQKLLQLLQKPGEGAKGLMEVTMKSLRSIRKAGEPQYP